jgi:pimeloyl-ACP methyl ester carboxylesterase
MDARIGNRKLAYDSYGSGPALVLVHAFPLDRRMWAATGPALALRCRVIAPDMRGFGASDLADGSIADMADDVASLLDELSVERATVGGLSMGGYVSLAFAARHKERLERLILADTRAAADSEATRAGRAAALALVDAQGVSPLVERQLVALLSADASEAVRAKVRSIGNEQRAAGVKAGICALRDRPDRQGELSAIACPTLLLVGKEDKISPPAEMAAMASAIPGSRLVEIAAAGHLSNLENPNDFIAAVRSFL